MDYTSIAEARQNGECDKTFEAQEAHLGEVMYVTARMSLVDNATLCDQIHWI